MWTNWLKRVGIPYRLKSIIAIVISASLFEAMDEVQWLLTHPKSTSDKEIYHSISFILLLFFNYYYLFSNSEMNRSLISADL